MVVGTIAGFLLLMVGLGLTGVVWQSVTQRIREFGLRRAKGATIRSVRAQVLTEMMIMTSLALIVGVALIAQLPLLPLPSEMRVIPAPVFVGSIIVSALGDLCPDAALRLAAEPPRHPDSTGRGFTLRIVTCCSRAACNRAGCYVPNVRSATCGVPCHVRSAGAAQCPAGRVK